MNLIYDTRRVSECVAAMRGVTVNGDPGGAVLELWLATKDAYRETIAEFGDEIPEAQRLAAALARFEIGDGQTHDGAESGRRVE